MRIRSFDIRSRVLRSETIRKARDTRTHLRSAGVQIFLIRESALERIDVRDDFARSESRDEKHRHRRMSVASRDGGKGAFDQIS